MSTLIMVNGEYGCNSWYEQQKKRFDHIICTDGAAARARQFNIMPDAIVGDMDSIHEVDLMFMEKNKIPIYYHPPEKDFTDTFLALMMATEEYKEDIVIWGGTGGRLDHTLANLSTASYFVRRGTRLLFDEPGLTINIIKDYLNIQGKAGDTVSIFPVGEKAEGVTLNGFKYTLVNATLEPDYPVGISNVLLRNEGRVFVESGVLSVIHYKDFDCTTL